MPEKIEATFILEMLGKPAEHIAQTMKDLIENNFKKEEGIKVIDVRISEPVEIQERKDFFSLFAEIDAEFSDLDHLLLALFKYYPSNVEVVRPEKMNMTNVDMNMLLNEIARRIHGYEEITRVLQIERAKLEKKLKDSTSS